MLVAPACQSESSVTCDNGTICAPGMACTKAGTCVPSDQIEACADKGNGDACSSSLGGGFCDDSLCLVPRCGDGRIDSAETCDDSNEVSGDGCSADCRKVEVCGDGALDVGEVCDDGNANAVDGCDSCLVTEWRAEALLGVPSNVSGLSDPSSVAFDGLGNIYIADTGNHRIRRVDASTGLSTTVAGSGNRRGGRRWRERHECTAAEPLWSCRRRTGKRLHRRYW